MRLEFFNDFRLEEVEVNRSRHDQLTVFLTTFETVDENYFKKERKTSIMFSLARFSIRTNHKKTKVTINGGDKT